MSTALVLIDLQNDYFPGGAMELVGADAAVEHASRLLQAFRGKQLPIFHVQHASTRAGATFLLPGTRGAEIHPAVQPQGNEPVTIKHFPNAFRETTLLDALRSAGVTKVTFAGMMTHMCVDTSVRAAADLGFQCSLAADACATRDLQYAGTPIAASAVQLAYLAGLNGLIARVKSTGELTSEL